MTPVLMPEYARIDNTSDTRTGLFTESHSTTWQQGERVITQAKNTRAWKIISDTTNDNGHREVIFHRSHHNNKCRITFVPAHHPEPEQHATPIVMTRSGAQHLLPGFEVPTEPSGQRRLF